MLHHLALLPPGLPGQLPAQPGQDLDSLGMPATQCFDRQRQEMDSLVPASVEVIGHLALVPVLQRAVSLLGSLLPLTLLEQTCQGDIEGGVMARIPTWYVDIC